jgi:hypothetical protein
MDLKYNLTPSTAFSTLANLAAGSSLGVHLRPGATKEAIGEMQSAARRDLREEIPESYVAFLCFTNGAQIQNVFFKEAENIVAENTDLPLPTVIRLGNSGNIADYLFDIRDRRFHETNVGSPDERFASFGTFQELLVDVMSSQLGLKASNEFG